MDNQQLSNVNGLNILARNAKFGDGYFWKHPECKNSKIIFTSTDKQVLEKKMSLLPHIFPSGISLYRKGSSSDCFKNSKPLYKLASLVHPVFTMYHNMDKLHIIRELTVFDFALWYLDDGCCVGSIDSRFNFSISIGNTATNKVNKKAFLAKIKELFGHIKTRSGTIGTIYKNNSRATENNMIWKIPIPIAMYISNVAAEFHYVRRKCPFVKSSETIPEGSTTIGIISGKQWHKRKLI